MSFKEEWKDDQGATRSPEGELGGLGGEETLSLSAIGIGPGAKLAPPPIEGWAKGVVLAFYCLLLSHCIVIAASSWN